MKQNLVEQSELFDDTEEYFYHGYVTNINVIMELKVLVIIYY